MWSSIQEAYFKTRWNLSRAVFQSVWTTNVMAKYLRFRPLGGSNHWRYHRRKRGDDIQGTWVLPGQAISVGTAPKTVQVISELRQIVSQQEIPDYIVQNMSDPMDVWASNMAEAAKDIGRQIFKAAIVGQYIDTATLVANGSLTAATTGTITPGPYNHPSLGLGALKYRAATNDFAYKAPGDTDYGDFVVGAVGVAMRVFSANMAGYITFTPAALPVADQMTEIAFTSTTQQPDGLNALIDPAQVIASGVNGDAVSFSKLNRLLSSLAEPYQQDPQTVFIMHSNQLNNLIDLAHAFGGAVVKEEPFEVIDKSGPGFVQGTTQTMSVFKYRGHPILPCDHLPATAKGATASTRSIYCVSLNPSLMDGQVVGETGDVPCGGFFGLASGMMDGPMLQGPYGLGFSVKRITPELRTTEAQRMGWMGAFGLGSALAAARADNIID